ncbi:hypothetical protein [Burkholderia cenocepacia]|uniref:hypothetical protein n=1 Tax=Burkholderia cenocepacia TaxID=95486 RepID=UPI00222E411C|nr:hypothetical protein [Burkholderia cenocepacia]MCW3632874.1 hypothetical protein [Burkholderia cenocepacia]MCW5182344.1 hypothetical protein [Burkholderia cenocepacia]
MKWVTDAVIATFLCVVIAVGAVLGWNQVNRYFENAFGVNGAVIESTVASDNECVLPGKGALSEGWVDVYDGRTVRCVRTLVLDASHRWRPGPLTWVGGADDRK